MSFRTGTVNDLIEAGPQINASGVVSDVKFVLEVPLTDKSNAPCLIDF